jgi:hypothetical protein
MAGMIAALRSGESPVEANCMNQRIPLDIPYAYSVNIYLELVFCLLLHNALLLFDEQKSVVHTLPCVTRSAMPPAISLRVKDMRAFPCGASAPRLAARPWPSTAIMRTRKSCCFPSVKKLSTA